MHESRRKVVPAAVVALIAALQGGCSSTSGWLDRVWSSDSDVPGEPLSPGSPNADDYLRDLDLLATGDPATRAEIVADAEAASDLTPGPTTNLRYALVLATPGHADTNLEEAQSMLREVLAQSALMTPSEVALAHIYLNTVEERLTLESEARQLRESSVARSDRTEEQALAQRLSAVEAENRRLRAELSDAQEKLDAITSIERSIREQGQ
ncbi:MAG TPA: hypothetical protein VFY03_03700 [Woeseiaceae bacterium]|nr:hypothetical protein [Woeseiaceae bacterium]